MKHKALPAKLTIALASYYLGRFRSKSTETGHTTCDGYIVARQYSVPTPWNKDESLRQIDAALPKGWGYSASSGTFWFHVKHSRIEVSESSWPLGIVTKVKKTS